VSALDAHVRKAIFKQVFNGICKSKTRILATHALDFLSQADKIVIMKEGRIAAYGSYDELLDNPLLQEVLAVHGKDHSSGDTK
jgi:ABC-type multidrug transport system fused ATPase/permease subunit